MDKSIETVFEDFDNGPLKDNMFSFVFIAVFKLLDKSNILEYTLSLVYEKYTTDIDTVTKDDGKR